MSNELVLIFSAKRMQELMEQNPDKIVVRSTIEQERLGSGEEVGVIGVYADAVQIGNVSATIEGCPIPPCSID